MKYILFSWFFIKIILAQELPVKYLSVIVQKVTEYNSIKTSGYLVVYDEKKSRAKKLANLLNVKAVYYKKIKENSGYLSLIFLGMSGKKIRKVKKSYSKILSISDNEKNIENVSIVFSLRENGKLLILINPDIAKVEAKFNSNFLNVAKIYKSE